MNLPSTAPARMRCARRLTFGLALAACVAAIAAPAEAASPDPAASARYAAVVLADQPAGYWRLDETSGAKAADSSGNGLDGVVYGGVAWGVPSGAVATGSTGATFDGTTGYIRVPDDSRLQIDRDLTLEFWVKAKTLAPNEPVVRRRMTAVSKHYANEFDSLIEPAGLVSFYQGNCPSGTVGFCSNAGTSGVGWEEINEPVAAVVPHGVWSHVAVVRTAAERTLRWYINGQYVGMDTYTVDPARSTRDLFIGKREATGEFMQGAMDEVAVYPAALTAERLRRHYVVGIDAAAPVIAGHSDVDLEAAGPAGTAVTYALPTAADALDGATPVSCTPGPGATFAIGTTPVTCSSTDVAGNTGTSTFAVVVRDTTAPVLTTPTDIHAAATGAAGATASYSTSAIDSVDGQVAVSCSLPSGSTFGAGTTRVTCSAQDAAHNIASGAFDVRVTYSMSSLLAPFAANDANVFKLGSTIPVKFRLTGASAGIDNAVARLTVAKVTNGTVGSEVAAVSTSAAGTASLFRYTDGQYMFNLATKGLTTGTYQLRVDMGDGVGRVTPFSLR